jgi:hypothetical protein
VSRTNLEIQSQTFNTSWIPTGVTVGGSVTLPSGAIGTANKLMEDASTGEHNIASSVANATTTQYTLSVVAKAAERSFVLLVPGSLANAGVWFNLTTGAVGTKQAAAGSAAITNLGNGWYLCQTTWTSTSALVCKIYVTSADNVVSYAGSAGSGIYLFYAQREAAAFASTPIFTGASAVTRAADILTYPSAGNVSGTVGTAYAEFTSSTVVGYGTARGIINTNNGLVKGPLYIPGSTTNSVRMNPDTGSVVDSGATVADFGSVRKAASTWGTASSCYMAGTGASGAAASFTGSEFAIGQTASVNQLYGSIRNVKIYATALSAAQLQALTT